MTPDNWCPKADEFTCFCEYCSVLWKLWHDENYPDCRCSTDITRPHDFDEWLKWSEEDAK